MEEDTAGSAVTEDANPTAVEPDAVSEAKTTDATAAPPTSLVEISPGVALVFGSAPAELELTDLGLVPELDREKLAQAFGTLANASTAAGSAAQALSSVKGVYRLTEQSRQMLAAGGRLASKDGANLGAIFQNGKIVGQARFVPVSVSAGAMVAAVGPAVAMLALQMQLSEVSNLVKVNITLTTDTLKVIRNDQWAALSGVAASIDRAVAEAKGVEAVTDSIWEPVVSERSEIKKQLELTRRAVKTHLTAISDRHGSSRRHYLETNAEAILFDAYGILTALKADIGYRTLRIAHTRADGVENPKEAELAAILSDEAHVEFDQALTDARSLVHNLTKELNIIAELPGRATLPLTRKRRDANATQLTCQQLLEAIQPLADSLRPNNQELREPEATCAPADFDASAYLRILRWTLEPDEKLRAIAFPYTPGSHNVAGTIPGVLGLRVDAAWNGLAPRRLATLVGKVSPATMVAITDTRVITANAATFLTEGTIESATPLEDVQFVRPPSDQHESVRATVDVITKKQNIRWLFPAEADKSALEAFVSTITAGAAEAKETIESDASGDPAQITAQAAE